MEADNDPNTLDQFVCELCEWNPPAADGEENDAESTGKQREEHMDSPEHVSRKILDDNGMWPGKSGIAKVFELTFTGEVRCDPCDSVHVGTVEALHHQTTIEHWMRMKERQLNSSDSLADVAFIPYCKECNELLEGDQTDFEIHQRLHPNDDEDEAGRSEQQSLSDIIKQQTSGRPTTTKTGQTPSPEMIELSASTGGAGDETMNAAVDDSQTVAADNNPDDSQGIPPADDDNNGGEDPSAAAAADSSVLLILALIETVPTDQLACLDGDLRSLENIHSSQSSVPFPTEQVRELQSDMEKAEMGLKLLEGQQQEFVGDSDQSMKNLMQARLFTETINSNRVEGVKLRLQWAFDAGITEELSDDSKGILSDLLAKISALSADQSVELGGSINDDPMNDGNLDANLGHVEDEEKKQALLNLLLGMVQEDKEQAPEGEDDGASWRNALYGGDDNDDDGGGQNYNNMDNDYVNDDNEDDRDEGGVPKPSTSSTSVDAVKKKEAGAKEVIGQGEKEDEREAERKRAKSEALEKLKKNVEPVDDDDDDDITEIQEVPRQSKTDDKKNLGGGLLRKTGGPEIDIVFEKKEQKAANLLETLSKLRALATNKADEEKGKKSDDVIINYELLAMEEPEPRIFGSYRQIVFPDRIDKAKAKKLWIAPLAHEWDEDNPPQHVLDAIRKEAEEAEDKRREPIPLMAVNTDGGKSDGAFKLPDFTKTEILQDQVQVKGRMRHRDKPPPASSATDAAPPRSSWKERQKMGRFRDPDTQPLGEVESWGWKKKREGNQENDHQAAENNAGGAGGRGGGDGGRGGGGGVGRFPGKGRGGGGSNAGGFGGNKDKKNVDGGGGGGFTSWGAPTSLSGDANNFVSWGGAPTSANANESKVGSSNSHAQAGGGIKRKGMPPPPTRGPRTPPDYGGSRTTTGYTGGGTSIDYPSGGQSNTSGQESYSTPLMYTPPAKKKSKPSAASTPRPQDQKWRSGGVLKSTKDVVKANLRDEPMTYEEIAANSASANATATVTSGTTSDPSNYYSSNQQQQYQPPQQQQQQQYQPISAASSGAVSGYTSYQQGGGTASGNNGNSYNPYQASYHGYAGYFLPGSAADPNQQSQQQQQQQATYQQAATAGYQATYQQTAATGAGATDYSAAWAAYFANGGYYDPNTGSYSYSGQYQQHQQPQPQPTAAAAAATTTTAVDPASYYANYYEQQKQLQQQQQQQQQQETPPPPPPTYKKPYQPPPPKSPQPIPPPPPKASYPKAVPPPPRQSANVSGGSNSNNKPTWKPIQSSQQPVHQSRPISSKDTTTMAAGPRPGTLGSLTTPLSSIATSNVGATSSNSRQMMDAGFSSGGGPGEIGSSRRESSSSSRSSSSNRDHRERDRDRDSHRSSHDYHQQRSSGSSGRRDRGGGGGGGERDPRRSSRH